ncbi:MAG: ATP-binding protein [Cyclobacteriaceae bacterium]
MSLTNDKVKLALAYVPSGVIITDVGGRIEWVNQGFTSITGYHLEEIVGKKPGSFLQGPKTSGSTVRRMSEALKKREPFKVDTLNYHKDGSEMWCTVVCDPIVNDQNVCIGFMSIQPVIPDHRVQDTAKEKASSNIMHGLFEGALFPMILVNDEMRVVNANTATLNLLGYTKAEFLTLSVHDYMAEEVDALVPSLWNEFMINENQGGRAILKRKDSSMVTVEYLATKDVVPGIHLSILMDVSQREQDEQLMLAKKEELEILNKEKLKILSILAHDLAGPIQNLGDVISLLKGKNIDQNQFDFLLSEVMSSYSNTKDFLANMVSWANNQINGIKITNEEVDLYEIVHAQLKSYQQVLRNKDITIKAEIERQLIVKADMQIVNLVLRNLVSNAIKFCKQHDQILIKVTKKEEHAMISVVDTGLGIKPEDVDKVFDINFSKGQKVNPTGYGLGLNMCKEFLEAMGEKIWVESTYGKGAAFHFTLSY